MYVTRENNAGERLVTVREDADDAPLATFVLYGNELRYTRRDREPRREYVNAALEAVPGAHYVKRT